MKNTLRFIIALLISAIPPLTVSTLAIPAHADTPPTPAPSSAPTTSPREAPSATGSSFESCTTISKTDQLCFSFDDPKVDPRQAPESTEPSVGTRDAPETGDEWFGHLPSDWNPPTCDNPQNFLADHWNTYVSRFNVCSGMDYFLILRKKGIPVGITRYVSVFSVDTRQTPGSPVRFTHKIMKVKSAGSIGTATFRSSIGVEKKAFGVPDEWERETKYPEKSGLKSTFNHTPKMLDKTAWLYGPTGYVRATTTLAKGKWTKPFPLPIGPMYRCDTIITSKPGCVAGATPSYRPSPKNRGYHAHIKQAIASGLPNELRRTTDPTLKKKNREAACPKRITSKRPKGYSCDEYPFASTDNGAAGLGAGRARSSYPSLNCRMPDPYRRGPSGFSRCFIPEDENSAGGGEIRTFYNQHRVLNGDTFYVKP